jgi:hypothetical protein
MKHKALLYAALLPAIGLGLLGMNAASAHGLFGGFAKLNPDEVATHQTARFEHDAALIGATVDEVKNAWSEGKSVFELAKEKGLTEEQLREKMTEARKSEMRGNLDTLVQKAVITQAQADARLKAMENAPKGKGRGMGPSMGRGFHGGFGR